MMMQDGWAAQPGKGCSGGLVNRAGSAVTMRQLVVFTFLILSANQVHGQADVKVWTRLAGTGNYDEGYAVAADPAGNCIIAGETLGGMFPSFYGKRDLFVAKYDTNGNLLWGRQRGTSERDCAFGLATDSLGNIYATGFTAAALDGQSHIGNWDIFLMKFSPTGDWLWTRQIGTGQNDEAYAVTTDAWDNIYITGYVRGDMHGQTRVGSADVFICKYNSSGTRLWTRLFGSEEIEQAWGITCDASGNVFVTGYTMGSIDGLPYIANGDIFLAKYDANGNRLWLRVWGTVNAEHGYSLATDEAGNVYVSGYTTGALYGSQMGNRDAFLAKFDAAGNQLWGRQFGTAEHDQAWGVAMGADGNVYLAGQVAGSIDGSPHQGGLDVFLAKYNPSGTRLWLTQVGSTADDWARGGLAVAPGGITYLSGITTGNLDGNINSGLTDAFAMKFIPGAPLEPTDAQASPSTVCSGGASQLSATPGTGGDSVEWFTVGCGGTAVPGGVSPTVNPAVTTTYYARTKDSATGTTSITCATVTVTVVPSAPADLDGDCDVDQADFNIFYACFSGPGVALSPGCESSDFDGDNDVDQSDFAVLQRCFSGPNVAADPNCAN
jgi:hypothetical protein